MDANNVRVNIGSGNGLVPSGNKINFSIENCILIQISLKYVPIGPTN